MNNEVKQKLLIGSSYSLLALVTVKCIEVVTSIIVARLLGPQKLGMFSIIRYLLDLLCIFTVIGIPSAMVKFIAELPEKPSNYSLISTAFIITLIPTLIICAITNLASGFIANNIYHEPLLENLIKISLITLFAMSLLAFGESILQGLQAIKNLALIRIIYSLLALPITILLVFYGNLKGAIISRAVVMSLSIIIVFFALSRIHIRQSWQLELKYHSLIDSSFIKKLLNLALPIFLSGVLMVPALWIVTTRLSIDKGFVQVGLFNVAYALMQVILFVSVAVGTPFLPYISKINVEAPKELSSIIGNILYIVGIVTLFIALFFALFSHKILLLLYGTKYLDAWQILIFLSISAFLASLGYIIGYYLLAVNKMWIGMGFNLLWFVTLIGISIPLVKFYGIIGLGFSYIGSYTILIIAMLIFIKKELMLKLTPLVLLLFSGLLFFAISYHLVSHFYGKVFIIGAILLLFAFMLVEYFLCPIRKNIFALLKNAI
ncbi:MAG: oligosaccharide flippase family protein [bacterium]|nr:oligosaccharide flippase family protein [bacterium]